MPFSKYAATPSDPHFREALMLWARKFVGSDILANRIVERTISVLCNDPELLAARDVNQAVFALLRRHAFDEIEHVPGVPLGAACAPDDERAL